MRLPFALLLTAVTVAAAAPAHADEIVLPPDVGHAGSCEPFDCATHIQQVFDAALFGGSMRIDAITFSNTHIADGRFVEPAQYRFSLSTTSMSSTSIGTNYAANIGADNRMVIDWTVSGFDTTFTHLTLPLASPFAFNPARGNLLLDITKDRTANFGDGPIYADANTAARGTEMVTDYLGGSNVTVRSHFGTSIGFVGHFSATPEPASLFLIGSGLAAVALRSRRRR